MFDHSSDPNFLTYYERESASEETLGRFLRIRERAISLWTERNRPRRVLDVVDIGCGAGTQALLWAELGHHVRALDVNGPLLEVGRRRAREFALSIDFKLGTATALPYETASADVCLLPELLEHVADWQSCLREAARVLRPGGLLYVSTTNWLCPKQDEFNLPLYSWYPPPLKRYFENLAVTTRADLANYARYPAVNWFSFFQLRTFLTPLGFECLDRFDVLARQPLSAVRRLVVSAARASDATRAVAHIFSGGTTVWALKRAT